jgi:acetaldehyde dehydrogenase/alcohol dehydrogenase
VIRFNATDNPTKQAAFPQYRYPGAVVRYVRIADYLQLGGNTDEDKISALVSALDQMKRSLNIPASIKDYGINEEEFLARVDELAEEAFDDQCTGTNPRYPLINEIRELYLQAYYGK